MTRDQLRQHIDTLELLVDVTQAIEDVQGVEFEPHEPHTLKLCVADSSQEQRPVSFLHNLPPDLLLVALRAIERTVREQAAQTQLAVEA